MLTGEGCFVEATESEPLKILNIPTEEDGLLARDVVPGRLAVRRYHGKPRLHRKANTFLQLEDVCSHFTMLI